jgi:hypothetical protein
VVAATPPELELELEPPELELELEELEPPELELEPPELELEEDGALLSSLLQAVRPAIAATARHSAVRLNIKLSPRFLGRRSKRLECSGRISR